MERTFLSHLQIWVKNPFRKPLLIRGARQVGKTFMIEQLGAWGKAAGLFDSSLTINFELEPDYKACFESLQPEKILNLIRVMKNIPITPGRTLLFLDEIQECPNAISALRYFKELVPDLHVIAAGSLLEFALSREEISMPVGRVDYGYIYPCSFEEFLMNAGQSDLQEAMDKTTLESPLPSMLHEKLLRLFREFLVIGGMPEALNTYFRTKDLYEVQRVQNSILQTYRDDFGKYASLSDRRYLQRVYDKAPGLIGAQISYTKIDSEAKSRDLKGAIQMLEYAGLLRRVYATSASGLPLDTTVNEKKFKWYFLDTGLVQRKMGLDADLLLREDLIKLNSGAIAEQIVAQELFSYQDPFVRGELHFWARDALNSQAEVDFVLQIKGQITPIEVKSGAMGKLKSLMIFLSEKKISLGVKISTAPLSLEVTQESHVLNLPIYMIKQLPRLMADLE